MSSNEKCSIKMCGYLEKKSKMKVMSSWKNYWFVLEGRLLLYYRSKDTLSPCKGSINLGPRCTVKPAVGGTCIFQIETRSNTIILKAPNRLEQEKWLQAILTALNQSTSSPNGMVHFRYSSDDLMPAALETKKSSIFTRQNSMPGRLEFGKRERQQKLDRLQNIGGKTYGGSLETIRKLAKGRSPAIVRCCNSKKGKQSLSSHDITFTSGDETYSDLKRKTYAGEESRGSFLIENDQYCAILGDEKEATQENHDDILRKSAPKSENIYERMSRDSQSAVADNESPARESRNTSSVIVDNENYQQHIYARVANDSNVSGENVAGNFFMEEADNIIYHEYNVPDKQDFENLYSVPQFDRHTDHNDNSVISPVHSSVDVNPYSICQIYSKNALPEKFEEEKLYDSPGECFEPQLPPRPSETKPNEHPHDNLSNILSKLKIFSTHGTGDEKHIKVVKKYSLIRRIFKIKERRNVEEKEDEHYATIDECVINKLERNPETDKQVLEELKKILMNKQRSLEVHIVTEKASGDEVRNGNAANDEEFVNNASGKHTKPVLPDKQKKYGERSLFARFKNKTRKFPPAINNEAEKIKTIDEILNDLDAEKEEQDMKLGNVKRLIEKFDKKERTDDEQCKQNFKQLVVKLSHDSNSDDIVLRQKSPNTHKKICAEEEERHRNIDVDENVYRHSDELNRLLNELIKVTNAPILTPGVTSSLGVTLTDEELLKLTQDKRRRFSDPDYDIPRPHTNLKITRNDQKTDGMLTATRFFGPVLNNNGRHPESLTQASMAPDSLEVSATKLNLDEDVSYTSHGYKKEMSPTLTPTKQNIEHGAVYEATGLLHRTCDISPIPKHPETDTKQQVPKTSYYAMIDLEENLSSDIFIDSLEPFNETSTIL